MTQGENVNPYPRKQKRREGKFPIKEKAKKEEKENFQSKRKQKKGERKFPVNEWEKAKRLNTI